MPEFSASFLKSVLPALAIAATIAGCHAPSVPPPTPVIPPTENEQTMTYPQALHLLDSVAMLPLEPILQNAIGIYDSSFRAVTAMNREMTPEDSETLRWSVQAGKVPRAVVEKRLPELNLKELGYEEDDSIPVQGIILPKQRGLKGKAEAVICFESFGAWDCDCFLLAENAIRAHKRVSHRYGLELQAFQDEEGFPVLYTKENFASGTGIWEYQWVFYRVVAGELIPSLTLPAIINLAPMADLQYSAETKILSTAPLKMQVEYEITLSDSQYNPQTFAKDKINLHYSFDPNHQLQEQTGADLNPVHAITLYDNHLLFLKVYNAQLKDWLQGKDPHKRNAALMQVQRCRVGMNWEG